MDLLLKWKHITKLRTPHKIKSHKIILLMKKRLKINQKKD